MKKGSRCGYDAETGDAARVKLVPFPKPGGRMRPEVELRLGLQPLAGGWKGMQESADEITMSVTDEHWNELGLS
jgi:hypothetical protein